MTIHHIGYAVKSIPDSIKHFTELGFTPMEEAIVDNARNITIQFLKNGDYCVELVAPLGSGRSPVSEILRKSGNQPYHICYNSSNLQEDMDNLKKQGYVVINEPLEAIAIGNRKVTFMYHMNVGLIELVEE